MNYEDILQQMQEQRRLRGETRPINARAVFDALAVAGITQVVATFDGSGDSGQVEEVTASVGDDDAELPSVMVEHIDVNYDGTKTGAEVDLRQAIENIVYEVLEETHAGWENNDGAYGDVTFNVSERKIHLDFNERFTDSTLYEHDFSCAPEGDQDVPDGDRGFV